ncbi:penicillin-binding protein activator [Marinomonas sp. IMCC 4694]|uniref:penicillin-binding protein activator n=1 Tax=Marinomonas sp. IMCC 4694 TaxID=2605432 RepID=UPI0021CCA630|nr:penicillin-binding protein activator [Marinomonas sp. IMCC 4694]
MEKPRVVTQAENKNPAQDERTDLPSIYHPLKASSASQRVINAYKDAQVFYGQAEYQQALTTLTANVLPKTSSVQFEAYLLAAASASELNYLADALHYVQSAEKLAVARRSDNQNRLKLTQASIFEHVDDWLTVINLRMDLSFSLPLSEKQKNDAKLWLAIQSLTQNELEALFQQQKPLLNGWLSISEILRDPSLSIEQQLTMFSLWQTGNPNHPAAISPPHDFQVLSSVKDMAPQKMVLLLPMSGKLERASQAIVDGFFAAYYRQTSARPQVTVINTENYPNIIEALAAANNRQPDIIIGPLQKNNVAQISRVVLPYPVIALNQLDVNQHPKNLYHFSLTAEDEIHELISFAKQEGANSAAILSTQDTWALKQSDEFRVAAETENVIITSNQSYANTPKGRQDAIQKLLLVNESYGRKSLVETWTDTKVDSVSRSRRDLDYVYFVGKLNDAKQIRPLLDFYFADTIPMLASSTLNDSAPDNSINPSDIERILFTEAPALLPTNTSLNELPSNQNSNILRRLQALGADAYLLANKHTLFTLLPSTKISANTGIITMDKTGVFHKRPEIMTYRKGNLVYANNQLFFKQKEDTQK